MRNKTLRILSCMVLATGTLLGLAGCSNISSQSIQTEENIIASNVDSSTEEYDERSRIKNLAT